MNPQKKSNTRLEDLPNDFLSEILAKVGSHSREDLGHCMLACTELLGAVDDPKVYGRKWKVPSSSSQRPSIRQSGCPVCERDA
ncbi:unnamed protein product [Cochlearia groenlandica]